MEKANIETQVETVSNVMRLFGKIEITKLSVEPGIPITVANFPGHFIYYMVEGQVIETIFSGKTVPESKFKRYGGDWIGYSTLFNDNTYMASAITLEPTLLLQFSAVEVRKLMGREPAVSEYINNLVRKNLILLYKLSD